MQQPVRGAILGAILLMVTAMTLPGAAADSATIVNTGSTNTAGFRIVVERSGNAVYTITRRRPSPDGNEKPAPPPQQISKDLVQRLFSDLDAAQPLESLPTPHCAKSASFGSRLSIEFGGSATPDLSCGDGGDAKMRALIKDSREIVALFSAK